MARITREQIDREKATARSLLSHGCALDAGRRSMSAAMRLACDELVAEGWAYKVKHLPWAKSGSYAATDKLREERR